MSRCPKNILRISIFFLPEDPELYVPFATIVRVDQGFKKYRYPPDPKSALRADQGATALSDMLMAFEGAFWSGKNRQPMWLRSEEPIPLSQEPGVVVHQLVGSNFAEHVIKNKKDVLVFFNAPWCGHCKRFEARFNLLAHKFAPVTSINFFRVDVTKNDIDHPEISIHRVPYVRFFRAFDKDHPVTFDHSQTEVVEYGTKFLQTHAQISFDLNRIDAEL